MGPLLAPEKNIGQRIFVPNYRRLNEAPFTGILQQKLPGDDWYVRDRDHDLCGPYAEDDLYPFIYAGTIVKVKRDRHTNPSLAVVVFNQGFARGNPTLLLVEYLDPEHIEDVPWPYNVADYHDVSVAIEDQLPKSAQEQLKQKSLTYQARHHDLW